MSEAYNPSIEQEPKRKGLSRRSTILVAVAVLLLAVALGGNVLPQILSRQQYIPGPKSSGPSASWGSMIARADTEAAKIDSNAPLGGIDVAAPGGNDGVAYTGPNTGSLELNFTYFRANGDFFWIDFEDADPQRTLHVFPGTGHAHTGEQSNYNSAIGIRPRFRQVLASTKITPREAVQLTWSAAQKDAEAQCWKGVKLNPLVFPSTYPPARWDVSYSRVFPPRPPGMTANEANATIIAGGLSGLSQPCNPKGWDLMLSFDVDAVNGKVTNTDSDLNGTPAATPSPVP